MNALLGSLKAKAAGSLGSISAVLATLGSSWQVCHSVCLALLAALAAVGIIGIGFPLLFLYEYNLYFWGTAAALLLVTLFFFARNRKCVPEKLLVFNAGIVIAGIPFGQAQPYSWAVGGIIAIAAVAWFLFERITKRRN